MIGNVQAQDTPTELRSRVEAVGYETVPARNSIDGAFEIVQVRSREDRQLPLSDPSVRYEVNQAVAKEQLTQAFQARVNALLANAKVEGL